MKHDGKLREGRRRGVLHGVVVAAALVACTAGGSGGGPADAGDAGSVCSGLFGRPNAATGLDASQCQPSCACGASVFAPPVYDAAFIQSLVTDWQPASPY